MYSNKREDVNDSLSPQKINEMAKNDPDFHVRADLIIHNVEDEDILKSIVLEDYSTEVCFEAIQKITDVDFLVDTCLNHPDFEIRLTSLNCILEGSLVENEKSDSLLDNIVFNDPEYFVCKFAAEHIDNQDTLLKILELSGDEIISGIAISKITDEDILTDLALNSSQEHIRRDAIDNPNLKNHEVISEIILKEDNEFNRYWACGKIKDEDYFWNLIFDGSYYQYLDYFNQFPHLSESFKYVYENDENEYHRQVAAHFIEDAVYLGNIFLNEPNENIRFEVIKNKNFKNQKILKDLLKSEINPDILSDVILKVEDISIKELMEISKTNHPKLRYNAIKKIAEKSSTVSIIHSSIYNSSSVLDFLMNIILNEKDKQMVFEVIKCINDNYYLSQIVLKSTDREVKLAAIKKIKTESLIYLSLKYSLRDRLISFNQLSFEKNLKHIALTENDSEIRQFAITKIEDFTFLRELASKGDDDSIIAKDMLNLLFEEISMIKSIKELEKLTHNNNAEISGIGRRLINDFADYENVIHEIKNISDMDELKNIASKDSNYFKRFVAENQLERILFHIRLDEINTEDNQKKLKDVFKDESFTPYIRHLAALKIRDDDFLS